MSDHSHNPAQGASHHPAHHVHETAPLHDRPDTWHDHSRDERPQSAHGEVGNAPLVIGVGVGLFLVIVAAVVIVDSFYRGYASERLSHMEEEAGNWGPEAKEGLAPGPALLARAEKQNTFLYQEGKEPRWIQLPAAGEVPAQNVALLPLSVAKESVVKDYAPVINGAKTQK